MKIILTYAIPFTRVPMMQVGDKGDSPRSFLVDVISGDTIDALQEAGVAGGLVAMAIAMLVALLVVIVAYYLKKRRVSLLNTHSSKAKRKKKYRKGIPALNPDSRTEVKHRRKHSSSGSSGHSSRHPGVKRKRKRRKPSASESETHANESNEGADAVTEQVTSQEEVQTPSSEHEHSGRRRKKRVVRKRRRRGKSRSSSTAMEKDGQWVRSPQDDPTWKYHNKRMAQEAKKAEDENN